MCFFIVVSEIIPESHLFHLTIVSENYKRMEKLISSFIELYNCGAKLNPKWQESPLTFLKKKKIFEDESSEDNLYLKKKIKHNQGKQVQINKIIWKLQCFVMRVLLDSLKDRVCYKKE
ncbi:hypothetical protein BpHYR1_031041 [Brachionus plicatilis]|uniref:Uncharacterized protein n=1 Tax=Brachionus plicatilis TaxID=10195 RepID=A0A3M7R2V7_BRAPC|nr:hypothetical protein BpHYR1_031041 [Brachionus plicatilis]